MGALREQMEREMVLRRMSVRTRQSYSGAAAQIQSYLLHLIEERKLAFSSCNVALHGLRFLYHETLKRPDLQFAIPRARMPQKLPEIFSREEIERLFASARLLKHRVLLMTTYSAGLRVSEVCALKITDTDSERLHHDATALIQSLHHIVATRAGHELPRPLPLN